MNAIILAAGYGDRMKPLTNNAHKTMLKIEGQLIISRIINYVTIHGVNRNIVFSGQQGSQEIESWRYTVSNLRYQRLY
ncbi:hypothetical protein EPICR_140039 [Candidatus Desulfarcum epimagneticum]|uniref:Nucleotidyl transferase domain-containing protein n=1 Tax=uncultured Desulfobacteraceae bacterium TaxID=218296 RepID=A0A484HDG1_9BACT|nr:hypothetical protein EPICR_140039 [uncultured Desulfobacteraceae bacterium]